VGLFKVDSVHFLPSQAIQTPKFSYRDDRCYVLATAGDDRALLPVGSTLHNLGKLFARFRDTQAGHTNFSIRQ